jgi:release factor glutamine methyltransferase
VREVRDHDPRHALDGGTDGLSAYRAIAADTMRLLAPGGHLVLEIGQGQENDVAQLLTDAELTLVGEPRRDLAGIARVLVARF